MTYLEPDSVTFLDKEVFTDVTAGDHVVPRGTRDRYEADLLVKAQFQNRSSYFLIHVENQSYNQANFNKRMFRYFARLHEKYDWPIYPVVVFSYERPKKAAESKYQIEFPDFLVLEFNYRVVQLNQLNWRDFLNQPQEYFELYERRQETSHVPRFFASCRVFTSKVKERITGYSRRSLNTKLYEKIPSIAI